MLGGDAGWWVEFDEIGQVAVEGIEPVDLLSNPSQPSFSSGALVCGRVAQPLRNRRAECAQALRLLPLLGGSHKPRAQMALVRHALFLLSSASRQLLLGLSSSFVFLAVGFDGDDGGSETGKHLVELIVKRSVLGVVPVLSDRARVPEAIDAKGQEPGWAPFVTSAKGEQGVKVWLPRAGSARSLRPGRRRR